MAFERVFSKLRRRREMYYGKRDGYERREEMVLPRACQDSGNQSPKEECMAQI